MSGRVRATPDRFPLALGDERPLLVDHLFQQFGVELDLGFGRRHEAPVVGPGLVVDLGEAPHLLREVALVDVADRHPFLAQGVFRGGVDRGVELVAFLQLAERQIPHQKVDRLAVAGAFEQVAVEPRVPVLENHRPDVVTLDQEPDLIVCCEVHRPEQALAAVAPQPLLGGGEECIGDLAVVDRLEESEHPVFAALELVPAAVELGGDPADRHPVALGKEVLGLGVLEERVLLSVQELHPVKDQRRHPLRMVTVEIEGDLDEALQVAP